MPRAEFQKEAHERLAKDFASYGYTTPSNRARFSESQRRPLDLLEMAVQRTRLRLLSITELFHEVCLPYKLWDLCLQLLHASKHEDSELVARLWRSLIYRYCCDTTISTHASMHGFTSSSRQSSEFLSCRNVISSYCLRCFQDRAGVGRYGGE